MNLLDQLELYTLKIGGKQASQKDYWMFVYRSMQSGLLMTKSMQNYMRYKLKGLGIDPKEYQPAH